MYFNIPSDPVTVNSDPVTVNSDPVIVTGGLLHRIQGGHYPETVQYVNTLCRHHVIWKLLYSVLIMQTLWDEVMFIFFCFEQNFRHEIMC